MYEKKISYVQEENLDSTRKICTKLPFLPQQKKLHNRTTVLYTKYVRNTKNFFPAEPKKLTQHLNCMVF
jgi:hypothetical protein